MEATIYGAADSKSHKPLFIILGIVVFLLIAISFIVLCENAKTKISTDIVNNNKIIELENRIKYLESLQNNTVKVSPVASVDFGEPQDIRVAIKPPEPPPEVLPVFVRREIIKKFVPISQKVEIPIEKSKTQAEIIRDDMILQKTSAINGWKYQIKQSQESLIRLNIMLQTASNTKQIQINIDNANKSIIGSNNNINYHH